MILISCGCNQDIHFMNVDNGDDYGECLVQYPWWPRLMTCFFGCIQSCWCNGISRLRTPCLIFHGAYSNSLVLLDKEREAFLSFFQCTLHLYPTMWTWIVRQAQHPTFSYRWCFTLAMIMIYLILISYSFLFRQLALHVNFLKLHFSGHLIVGCTKLYWTLWQWAC